jgi:RimJ/RimL family protein N-acetyltransferase
MPFLTGKLVRLRPFDTGDAERAYVWMNDPEVTEHLSARYPFSRKAEAEFIARGMEQASYTNLKLAIETLAEGRHIGDIGLRGTEPENRRAELGIAIGDKECWDHGYGTDAIVTLLRFAFDEMNLHRVVLDVDATNPRGIACYRKCGFVEEGRLRQHRYQGGRYLDVVVMGVLADEFRTLHASPSPPRRGGRRG